MALEFSGVVFPKWQKIWPHILVPCSSPLLLSASFLPLALLSDLLKLGSIPNVSTQYEVMEESISLLPKVIWLRLRYHETVAHHRSLASNYEEHLTLLPSQSWLLFSDWLSCSSEIPFSISLSSTPMLITLTVHNGMVCHTCLYLGAYRGKPSWLLLL